MTDDGFTCFTVVANMIELVAVGDASLVAISIFAVVISVVPQQLMNNTQIHNNVERYC